MVFQHIASYKHPFEKVYANVKGSVADISEMDTTNFTYVQINHFVANRALVVDLCEYINKSIEADRRNEIFSTWYDETYFNFYLNTVLMKNSSIKINILNGNTYAHAPYSASYKYKIGMIDKNKEYDIASKDIAINYLTTKKLLKHSFVISIDDKRLELFNKLFKAHNLLPLPQKVEGVHDKKNKPQMNCYLSHRSILLKAKELDLPFVCIFEDDAYPCNNIVRELDECLKNIPDDCDVIVIGHSGMLRGNSLNETFLKNIKCYGSHAYIVFNKAFDSYLRFLNKYKYADVFQFDDKDVNKSRYLATKKVMFIQFCEKKSMNGHSGYIMRQSGRDLTYNQIMKMGFSPIDKFVKGKTANKPKVRHIDHSKYYYG